MMGLLWERRGAYARHAARVKGGLPDGLEYASTMGRLTRTCAAALLGAPLLVAAPPSGPDATGVWWGSARVSNEWVDARCDYQGEGRAVTLELIQEGEQVRGYAGFDMPAQIGAACPPLRKRWRVRGSARGGGLVLRDDAGHEWTLGVRQGALVGLVAWKTGVGREEPLAEGYRMPSGETPLTRLSGEVSLSLSGAAAAPEPSPPAASPAPVPSASPPAVPASPGPAAPASPSGKPAAAASSSPAPEPAASASPGKAGGGGKGMGTLAIIGANVLGIGGFIAAAQLAQDTPSGSQNTCSPRECLVGVPGQGCDCGPNDTGIVTGASCGETPGGIPLGAACNPPARPCATGLSCNGGICEDSAGACPF
jgi:hypothetical protein